MVVLVGEEPLGESARTYYNTLVGKFDADKKHVEHVHDFWGDMITAAPVWWKRVLYVASRDGKLRAVTPYQFMDRHTFDLSRARKCCQVYPQPDGRLVPACVHNCLRR